MEGDVCYICYEPATAGAPFCKPAPCICKGSIHIHNSCLIALRKTSATCGICKTTFTNVSPGYIRNDRENSVIEYINVEHLRHVYTINNENLLHGPLRVYYPSGRLHSTVDYIYGEINGIVQNYYDNNTNSLQQTVRYIAGQRTGDALLYYENGALYKKLPFRDGQLDGEGFAYDLKGRITAQYYFKDGVELRAPADTAAAATPTKLQLKSALASAPASATVPEYDPLAGILITN